MIQVAATPMIVKPKIGFSIESIVGAGSRSPARSEGSSVALHDESEACSSAAGSPLNPGSVSPPPPPHTHHHHRHHQQHQHQHSHHAHHQQQQHDQLQQTAGGTTVFKPSALSAAAAAAAAAGYGSSSSSVAAAAAAAAAGQLAKGLQYVHEPLTPPPPPAHPHPHHPFAFAAAAAAAAAAHHFQPNPHHPQHQPTRDTYPLYPWLLSRHGRIFPHRFPGGECTSLLL